MTEAPLVVPGIEDSRRKRLGRWALAVAIALLVGIGLLLIFLLAQATNNRLLYERYYTRLFAINVAVAGVLLLVIGWGIYRLVMRLRRGKFGSRLLIKLAAIFGLVGVLPGLLIYVVSYQFVSRSIESWFDIKVEGALESGLTLARTSLDTQARDFGNQLRAASAAVAETPEALAALPLENLRTQLGASDVTLWSGAGRLIASAGQSRFQLTPERPSAQMLRNLRAQGMATQIEGLDDVTTGEAAPAARIRALVLVSGRSIGLVGEQRLLQAVQPLPTALVTHALAVQEANREYQERALGREGLRRMYIGTLTLSLFLSVFGAVLLAVVLGKQLATPLLMLADGVRQVAAGDLTPKVILRGRDELVGLTRSFADMTQQLADARAAVDASMREVDAARAHLQTILDNLTAGVIVLDRQGFIQSANPGATRVLRAPLAASTGRPLGSLPGLEDFGADVDAQFADFEGQRLEHGLENWQKSFELYGHAGGGVAADAVTLIARGAALPGGLRLLVFDDISEIVSAQRAQAWGEVARRLAHEIKNPLGGIRGAAQLLEMEIDSRELREYTQVIIREADRLQQLVDRLLAPHRRPQVVGDVNIHEVCERVRALIAAEFPRGLAVRRDYDISIPDFRGDREQLIQALLNIVHNAAQALGQRIAQGDAEIVLRTRVARQITIGKQRCRLALDLHVIDIGPGVPEAIKDRVFDPLVSGREGGSGLGLTLAQTFVQQHHGVIELDSRPGRTDFRILIPLP